VPRLVVANSEAVESRVAEHTLDIGFIEAPSHVPTLVADFCAEDELQVLCAPSHPLAGLESVTPKQLLGHAFISREPGSGTREVTDRYFENAGIRSHSLDMLMELGSPEAIKGLVSTGLGFAIMSRATIGKEIRLGQLVAVALSPRLMRTLSVVYPKERFRSRLSDTFIEFARERLRTAAER
jgi:DNA-binding transcriptional LysR family regulator